MFLEYGMRKKFIFLIFLSFVFAFAGNFAESVSPANFTVYAWSTPRPVETPAPTDAPTQEPTPTSNPTTKPTVKPRPTKAPTAKPTQKPTPTAKPRPTVAPSPTAVKPTAKPRPSRPTARPTVVPTPTEEPVPTAPLPTVKPRPLRPTATPERPLLPPVAVPDLQYPPTEPPEPTLSPDQMPEIPTPVPTPAPVTPAPTEKPLIGEASWSGLIRFITIVLYFASIFTGFYALLFFIICILFKKNPNIGFAIFKKKKKKKKSGSKKTSDGKSKKASTPPAKAEEKAKPIAFQRREDTGYKPVIELKPEAKPTKAPVAEKPKKPVKEVKPSQVKSTEKPAKPNRPTIVKATETPVKTNKVTKSSEPPKPAVPIKPVRTKKIDYTMETHVPPVKKNEFTVADIPKSDFAFDYTNHQSKKTDESGFTPDFSLHTEGKDLFKELDLNKLYEMPDRPKQDLPELKFDGLPESQLPEPEFENKPLIFNRFFDDSEDKK